MKTIISMNHVRYTGFLVDVIQESNTLRFSYVINEIAFFDWVEGQREAKILLSIMPESNKSYTFEVDNKKLAKVPCHRNISVVEKSYRSEKFFVCTNSCTLYINATAVGLTGPVFTKMNYATRRKEQYGNINYSVIEHYNWNGGESNREIYCDYQTYLDLKCKLEKEVKELRYSSTDVLGQIDKARELLDKFKKDIEENMSIWREGEALDLVQYSITTRHKKEEV